MSNRLQQFTIKLNSAPNSAIQKIITDNNGVYSKYDYVTKQSHIVWFEEIDEKELLKIMPDCEIKYNLELNYYYYEGNNHNLSPKEVTKQNINTVKNHMMTMKKMKSIEDGKPKQERPPVGGEKSKNK